MTRFLAPYLIGSVVFALFVSGLFYAGANWQRDKTDLNDANDYIEGTEDTRDATNDLPADDAGNVEWLLRPW